MAGEEAGEEERGKRRYGLLKSGLENLLLILNFFKFAGPGDPSNTYRKNSPQDASHYSHEKQHGGHHPFCHLRVRVAETNGAGKEEKPVHGAPFIFFKNQKR